MGTSNQVQLWRFGHTRALFLPQQLANKAKKVSHGTPKNFQGQLKGCKRYKYLKSIAKFNLSYQVKSHGGFTFWKSMTRNSRFHRPAETDQLKKNNVFVLLQSLFAQHWSNPTSSSISSLELQWTVWKCCSNSEVRVNCQTFQNILNRRKTPLDELQWSCRESGCSKSEVRVIVKHFRISRMDEELQWNAREWLFKLWGQGPTSSPN